MNARTRTHNNDIDNASYLGMKGTRKFRTVRAHVSNTTNYSEFIIAHAH